LDAKWDEGLPTTDNLMIRYNVFSWLINYLIRFYYWNIYNMLYTVYSKNTDKNDE
jgi:hypothetical protein